MKLLIFSIFPLISLFGVFLLENGTADTFYKRVIGEKKKSLVIGTSKAAQGIVPTVINSKLDLKGENSLYNFGFTNIHSPFGESYNSAIRKKLCEATKDGIFIVTVDAWSLSSSLPDPNNRSLMQDEKLFVGKLSSYSAKINLEYLLQHYINSYYEIPLRYFAQNSMHLMDDGWLKATPKIEGDRIKRVYESKVDEYERRGRSVAFSEYRFNKFIELIDFLREKGEVYVVLMPVDDAINTIERSIFPELVEQLYKYCKSIGIPFKDFTVSRTDYTYVDGVHLDYRAAPVFSNDLANWILEVRNTF
ncbi:hypothetical protein A33Q_3698 [Indibacter alkaliphilus LW1]|uniref:Uncharacterized protein n=1 Tax=Indibacter alkaliphilus (strain CCUG 57479 / KCTC 22604 / LW1) TaxID=1189612 RepID=S2D371_INDAL|nr:hypothetical protein A33Q_3698 [Indibacter alkaliphilus LW1]